MASEKMRCGKCGTLIRYEAKTVKLHQVPCTRCSFENPVEARAIARFVMTAPRKLRLLADAIRGKRVKEALVYLRFAQKRAARIVSNVVTSASANAENAYQMNPDELYISNVTVDGGPVLKRFMPRAMGRAAMVKKRTSHLTVKVREGRPILAVPRKKTPKAKAARPKIGKKNQGEA